MQNDNNRRNIRYYNNRYRNKRYNRYYYKIYIIKIHTSIIGIIKKNTETMFNTGNKKRIKIF